MKFTEVAQRLTIYESVYSLFELRLHNFSRMENKVHLQIGKWWLFMQSSECTLVHYFDLGKVKNSVMLCLCILTVAVLPLFLLLNILENLHEDFHLWL